jgi:nucleoside-diphosphate-sugar epimerase
VYGKTADDWNGPIPETAPLQVRWNFSPALNAEYVELDAQPVTPYGVSKVAQEMLGLQYWHSHGLHVVTGRLALHRRHRFRRKPSNMQVFPAGGSWRSRDVGDTGFCNAGQGHDPLATFVLICFV